MNHLFNFSYAELTAAAMESSRINEVSKKLLDYMQVKQPKMLHQFPALPVFMYAFAYNKLPREVAKLYVKTKLNKAPCYTLLSATDDMGRLKLDDEYTIHKDVKVVW